MLKQKAKLAQLITLKMAKLGPVNNSAAHIHIYIYIYIVGHFGHFKVNNLATSRSIVWPPFFEPIKIGVLGDFSVHNFQGLVQN